MIYMYNTNMRNICTKVAKNTDTSILFQNLTKIRIYFILYNETNLIYYYLLVFMLI